MKTTMPARRLPPALPPVRSLPVPRRRRGGEKTLRPDPARRPAVPLPPPAPAADMKGNTASAATKTKQKDDGHDLPSGARRAAVVKRERVPRPVRSGSAELASKVRSCRFGPSPLYLSENEKSPPPNSPASAK